MCVGWTEAQPADCESPRSLRPRKSNRANAECESAWNVLSVAHEMHQIIHDTLLDGRRLQLRAGMHTGDALCICCASSRSFVEKS